MFYAEMQAHSTGHGKVYVDGTHESSDPGKTEPGAETSKGAKYKESYDPYLGGNTVTFEIKAKPDDGYEFQGWKNGNTSADPWILDAGGSPIKTLSISQTKDVSSQVSDDDGTHAILYHIYAFFSVETYTLSFDKNEGSTEAPASITYTIETPSTTLPNYSGIKTAYTFDGWKPASNVGNWKTTELFDPRTGSSSGSFSRKWGNATLNAHWIPTGYTITYNPNGGNMKNHQDTSQGYNIESNGTADKIRDVEKTGSTFSGWKVTAAEGNWTLNQTLSAGTPLIGKYGNVTLTAQWDIVLCPITISLSGMDPGVSGIFTVSKDGAVLYTVAVASGSSVTIKDVESGTYKVTPTSWSWAYTGLSEQSSEVTDPVNGHTFAFTASKNTTKKHAEESRVNWKP